MSTVAILIAIFMAANDPNPTSCENAASALVVQVVKDVEKLNGKDRHPSEDLLLINQFETICKQARAPRPVKHIKKTKKGKK